MALPVSCLSPEELLVSDNKSFLFDVIVSGSEQKILSKMTFEEVGNLMWSLLENVEILKANSSINYSYKYDFVLNKLKKLYLEIQFWL